MPPKLHRRKRRTVVALTLGIAAVPAVALAATDAVPGDPFKLGQDNRIATTTSLTGTATDVRPDGVLHVRKESGGIGAAVKIDNAAPGVSQPGLIVRTRPGQVPIAVNSDAGKASFLNVDRLDGRDATDFLPTRLYGDGSRLIESIDGDGARVLIPLRCDPGDIALNAGGNARGAEDHINSITPFRSSYHIEFTDNDKPSKFSANIICMDSAPPHRPESS
jgi:hypothetical protein